MIRRKSVIALGVKYLRPEYCIAIGKLERSAKLSGEERQKILRDHASEDLWGDLGYIRNAIVHNRGYATENMGRCKLIKWYKRGDFILLTPEHMRPIFMALLKYRNDLYAKQFPPQTFRIVEYGPDGQELL